MREYVHSSYARMTARHAGAGGGRSTCAPTAAEADAPDGVSEGAPAAAEADAPDGVSEAAAAAWAACGCGGRPETTGPAGGPAVRQPDRQADTPFDSRPDGQTDAPRGRPLGANAACSQARNVGTRPSASDLCLKSDGGKLLFRGYRVLLLAMILMFGLGAMPLASGMADDMADDDPGASSGGVFRNTCNYDDSAWADEEEGREDRRNNHMMYSSEGGFVAFPGETDEEESEEEGGGVGLDDEGSGDEGSDDGAGSDPGGSDDEGAAGSGPSRSKRKVGPPDSPGHAAAPDGYQNANLSGPHRARRQQRQHSRGAMDASPTGAMDVDTPDAPALAARLEEARDEQPHRAAHDHNATLVALLHKSAARGGRMRAGDESPPPSDEDEDEPESDEDAEDAAPRMSAAAADQVREELEEITAGIDSREAFMPLTPGNQPHHGTMAAGLTAPGVCLHGDDADGDPSDDQLVSWARSFHHNPTAPTLGTVLQAVLARTTAPNTTVADAITAMRSQEPALHAELKHVLRTRWAGTVAMMAAADAAEDRGLAEAVSMHTQVVSELQNWTRRALTDVIKTHAGKVTGGANTATMEELRTQALPFAVYLDAAHRGSREAECRLRLHRALHTTEDRNRVLQQYEATPPPAAPRQGAARVETADAARKRRARHAKASEARGSGKREWILEQCRERGAVLPREGVSLQMLKMVWVELVLEQVYHCGVAANLDAEVAGDPGSPVPGSPIRAADVATLVCDDLVHRHYSDERVRNAVRRRDEADSPDAPAAAAAGEHRWQQQLQHDHATSGRAELSLGQRAADVIKDPGLVPYEQRGAAVVICQHCGAHRPAHEPAGNCCKNGALCSLPEWLPPDANSSEPSVRAARAIYDMWRADNIEGKLLRQYALTVNNALAVSFLRYSSLDAAGNVIKPQGGLQASAVAEHGASTSAASHRAAGTYRDWMPSIVVQGRCAVLVSPLEQAEPADRVPARSGFAQLYTFPGTQDPEAARAGGTATAQRMQEDGAADGALDDGTHASQHGYTVDPSMLNGQLHTMGPPPIGGELEEAIVARRVSFVAPANCSTQDKASIAALIRKLTALLQQCNPYVQDCYTAAEVLRQASDAGTLHARTLYMDASQRPDGKHYRQYNNMTDSSELSYMTTADPEVGRAPADFEVRLRASQSGDTRHWLIDAQNRSFDPTHFVLIHYTGRPGWSKDMKYVPNNADGTPKTDKDGQPVYKDLTPKMYYRYYSYHRDGWDDSLFRANRLYQEWIVSAFIKCDDERLSFLASKAGQDKLRVESYGATLDMLTSDAMLEAGGRRTVLPSTSPGSPRSQMMSYHDSMALSRACGNPTYFITFTANPTWPEVLERVKALGAAPTAVPANDTQEAKDAAAIKQEPLDKETARLRFDIMDEVFQAKALAMIKELTGGSTPADGALGAYLGHVVCWEFQKRGLPHVHILLWCQPHAIPTEGPMIDRVISAELPPEPPANLTRSPYKDQRLRDTVLNTMVHSCKCDGCCKRTGICKDGYPYAYTVATEDRRSAVNKHPAYKRRTPEQHPGSVKVNTTGNRVRTITSADIVPFSPYLTLKFDAHINVERCNAISAVKYLHKYVWKGPDMAMLRTEDTPAGGNAQRVATRGAQAGGEHNGTQAGEHNGTQVGEHNGTQVGTQVAAAAAPRVMTDDATGTRAGVAADAATPNGTAARPPLQKKPAPTPVDEVKQYQECRVVGSHSAFMHLRGYKMSEMYPLCQRLAVHLPNGEQVHYDKDDADAGRASLEQIHAQGPRLTTLTAWFIANTQKIVTVRAGPDGRQHAVHAVDTPYLSFAEEFHYNESTHEWTPRGKSTGKGSHRLGRLRYVSPAAGDEFFLRRLLLQRTSKGATSFADLRTVDGFEHPSFQAACVARGLCRGDAEYVRAIEVTRHLRRHRRSQH